MCHWRALSLLLSLLKHRATQTTPKKPSYSASSSESAAYVLPILSLTKEAENSSSTLPNVVIATPHYKEMRNRVLSFPRHETLKAKEQKSAKADGTPSVSSFNPALPSVVNKYTTLLQSSANSYRKSSP